MKIPASSSLLFATLAISSSSTSLAAPAGESSQATGMSTSSSNHHIASRRGSFNMARSDVEGAVLQKRGAECTAETLEKITNAIPGLAEPLKAIDTLLGSLIGPVVDPLLGIVGICATSAAAASAEAVPGDLSASDTEDPQSPPPPPNTPSLPSAPMSPPSPPSPPSAPVSPPSSSPSSAPTSPHRRDVLGNIRGRSLPPRDSAADDDQKPLDAASQTTPSPKDTLKGAAGSAESHVPPAGGAVGESDRTPVNPPAGPAGNPPAPLGQTPEAAKGEIPNAHKTPVGGTVEDKLPGPVAGAAGAAESAPPKRGAPEW